MDAINKTVSVIRAVDNEIVVVFAIAVFAFDIAIFIFSAGNWRSLICDSNDAAYVYKIDLFNVYIYILVGAMHLYHMRWTAAGTIERRI